MCDDDDGMYSSPSLVDLLLFRLCWSADKDGDDSNLDWTRIEYPDGRRNVVNM